MALYKPSFILNWRNDEIKRHIAAGTTLEWRAVLGRTAPMDLEIGIGNGSFLAPFAHAHAERDIIGVELLADYAVRADKKLSRGGSTNGRILIGDAKLFLLTVFADGSIEDVYVHFPDPWFKRRHKRRRLVNPDTLRIIARKMTRRLRIATDDLEYREWVDECMAVVGMYSPCVPWGPAPAENHFPTKYENKWRDQGKSVFYRTYQKIGQPNFSADEYIESQNLRFPLQRIRERFS